MKKLEEIQRGKLVSSYGGVGSIIETNTNGSLLISPYNKWPFYRDQDPNRLPEITDDRLLNFIKYKKGYPQLNRLVEMPESDSNVSKYYPTETEANRSVLAEYFPTWFYCEHCHKLKRLNEWETGWNNTFPNDNKFKENEPACYFCSGPKPDDELRKNKKKKKKKDATRISRIKLQQVRFVMASLDSGEMKDIPFDKLFKGTIDGNVWEYTKEYVSDLKYMNKGNADGLDSVYIKSGEKTISMSQIDRCYLVKNGEDTAFKLAVRGSQSLYFPEIVRSIFIPCGDIPSDEAEMDLQEFRYLINDDNYTGGINVKNDDLIVFRKPELKSHLKYITRISAVQRLKETSALVGYSRLGKATEMREWYDCEKERVVNDKTPALKKPFSCESHEMTYMPAVVSYGEGIFFELNLKKVIPENKEVFAHTLSHVIMKEVEFQCGYPLTSLKEKVYIDTDNDNAGILIYTIAGSEGSYGGLVSLADNGEIIKLIEIACERAKHCPNDPICLNSEKHHCYACLDLPETSCCEFNNHLDRKLFLEIINSTSSQRHPFQDAPESSSESNDISDSKDLNHIPTKDTHNSGNIDDISDGQEL